jgi:hypothetical protein
MISNRTRKAQEQAEVVSDGGENGVNAVLRSEKLDAAI